MSEKSAAEADERAIALRLLGESADLLDAASRKLAAVPNRAIPLIQVSENGYNYAVSLPSLEKPRKELRTAMAKLSSLWGINDSP